MIINIKDLTIKHDNIVAIDNINLNIERGEFIYLLGPNGAGKSTLVHTILKLIKPSSGICKTSYHIAGFLPQKLNVQNKFPATVKEVIYSGISSRNFFYTKAEKEKYKKLIGEFNLEKFEHKLISELSGGELQKVMLVRAIINDPDLLILDEPTSAIDQNFKKIIIDTIKRLNKDKKVTIILITHELLESDETNCSDRVIYIDKKIIFNDTYCKYLTTFVKHSREHHHV